MTGAAMAHALPKTSSFAAVALDLGPSQFKPMLNRREIEELFVLDAGGGAENPVWEAYFVESIVEFVVHGRRPTGVITEDDANWLVRMFGDKPSPTVPALLRGLVAEAERIPSILIGYALSCGAMRA